MKNIFYVSLTVFVLMSFTSNNWVTYKNEKANYEIKFPKKPKEKLRKRGGNVIYNTNY